MRRVITLACVVLIAVSLGHLLAAGQDKYGAFSYDKGLGTDDPSVVTHSTVKDDDAYLSWGCEGQDVEILYFSLKYGGDHGTTSVTATFPPGDPWPTKRWTYSLWLLGVPAEDIREFTRQALKSSRLILRVQNDGMAAKISEFSLEGLPEALPKLPCASHFLGK